MANEQAAARTISFFIVIFLSIEDDKLWDAAIIKPKTVSPKRRFSESLGTHRFQRAVSARDALRSHEALRREHAGSDAYPGLASDLCAIFNLNRDTLDFVDGAKTICEKIFRADNLLAAVSPDAGHEFPAEICDQASQFPDRRLR